MLAGGHVIAAAEASGAPVAADTAVSHMLSEANFAVLIWALLISIVVSLGSEVGAVCVRVSKWGLMVITDCTVGFPVDTDSISKV